MPAYLISPWLHVFIVLILPALIWPVDEPLSLVVVSDGAHDSLIIEWSGGPPTATGWQYRRRLGSDAGWRSWWEWTDVPGGANVRSYRVTGLGGARPYQFQLRPVLGSSYGTPSEIAGNWTQARDGYSAAAAEPVLELWRNGIVEGNGRTRWLVRNFTIIIPAGMRVEAGTSWTDPSHGVVTPVYAADGSGSVLFTDSGYVVHRSVARDDLLAAWLIEKIIKSVEVYP